MHVWASVDAAKTLFPGVYIQIWSNIALKANITTPAATLTLPYVVTNLYTQLFPYAYVILVSTK